MFYALHEEKSICSNHVIYSVNVTGRKREIGRAKVITVTLVYWYINFKSSPEKEKAYVAFRKELDNFWFSKKNESKLRFIPHT
ncbi:unnamed protein product [Brugia pahangi]|uniref:Transposase n=1 Tax=Brugia pahangi TaxID=6280 RepID=A0A0N4T3X6_BRUPA|nr:unnamed protein product [Brugia pahangi]